MRKRPFLLGLFATAGSAAFAQGGKKSSSSLGGGPDGELARVLGIDGMYQAYGRNPDGSEYRGSAEVVQQGNAVEFTWSIGAGTNRGSGTIEGRIVTVDFGDAHPVIYVVMEDRTLHGTWADGFAFEKLTPDAR